MQFVKPVRVGAHDTRYARSLERVSVNAVFIFVVDVDVVVKCCSHREYAATKVVQRTWFFAELVLQWCD